MKCPKCKSSKIYVENTYSAGDAGYTQRRVCNNCGAVLTFVSAMVNVDPAKGEGAFSLAKKMKKASEEASSGNAPSGTS